MKQIESQDVFPTSITHEPRCGTGNPLFHNGLSWDEINAILTTNEFASTYIVEADENKRYIKDYLVGSLHDGVTTLKKLQELSHAVSRGWTIKAEGLEFWTEEIYFKAATLMTGYRTTLHLYVGQEDGTSFPMHTDPDPVIVVCVQGIKSFQLEGYLPISLKAGDWLYIPAHHPHQAFSHTKSAIVSIGFHKWNSETPSLYLPNL